MLVRGKGAQVARLNTHQTRCTSPTDNSVIKRFAKVVGKDRDDIDAKHLTIPKVLPADRREPISYLCRSQRKSPAPSELRTHDPHHPRPPGFPLRRCASLREPRQSTFRQSSQRGSRPIPIRRIDPLAVQCGRSPAPPTEILRVP